MNKSCSECKQIKDASLFYKRSRAKDGLYSYCIECSRKISALFYKENREKEIKRIKEYQGANSEKVKAARKSNGAKIRDYNKNYQKNRRKVDPIYKLMGNVRRNTSEAFRYKEKNKHTLEMTGCSPIQLAQHLESLFKPGMSWENYGKWHIDHKIPLSSAKNEIELEKLCHFSNLQPLWATENLSKGSKMNWDKQS